MSSVTKETADAYNNKWVKRDLEQLRAKLAETKKMDELYTKANTERLKLQTELIEAQKKIKKLNRFEDYSYYVGGEITCKRMPRKYSWWLDHKALKGGK